MSGLSVSADGSHLQRDGAPFRYLVDTAWSAFLDATDAEWRHYLRRRHEQGFTSVAVSVLPILHDRSISATSREPFARTATGARTVRPDYLEVVRRYTEQAHAMGFVLTLVPLWCNYLPDTWGARRSPGSAMDPAERAGYLAALAEAVADLQPILSVSGDDDFTAAGSSERYLEMVGQLRRSAPGCLLTAHGTPTARLPDAVAAELDFYVYQSGHDDTRQEWCYELAERYRALTPRKPVVNLEPAYEQHGYGAGRGRFSAADVRQAVWWSVLGGASAGVGYGAHGVWQWHREGDRFTSGATSLEPFSWPTALQFRGADDVGFAADLIDRFQLWRLASRPDLVLDPVGGVRAGADADEDVIAIYRRFPLATTVPRDLTGYRLYAFDLARRTPVTLDVTPAPEAPGSSRIAQLDRPADLLVVAERRHG